jgi:hypothetical protein
MTADVSADCSDIDSADGDSQFFFEFSVTPADRLITTFFVRGIANSRPGDWCSGHWTYRDESGNVLIEGSGNAIRPNVVGDGYTATLHLAETLDGGNCTGDDGVAHLIDANPDWLLTLQRSGGKPLKGAEDVTVVVANVG